MRQFIFAILLLFCFTANSYAQFDQFTVYTAGLGAFSYQFYDHSKDNGSQRNILGDVAVGFFPAKKFMVGVASGLLADKLKNKVEDDDEIIKTQTKSYSFTIGPVVRYYIIKGFYCEGSYVLGKSRVQQNLQEFDIVFGDVYPGLSVEQKFESKVRGFSAGIGYSVFLDRGKHLALDLGVSYKRQEVKETDIKYSGFAAGFGISGFIFKSDN